MTTNLDGLYAITDPGLTPGDALLPAAEAALRGGARLLQYRDKQASLPEREQQAMALAALCRRHGSLFIVNDDPALAKHVEADGVHMGQSDGAINRARQQLGPEKIIGISCHGDLDLAWRAVEDGADYVALGRFFTSRTKPGAPSASLAVLAAACRSLPVPVVAIGGVTPDNAGQLCHQGARTLAVIHALFADPSPAAVERQAQRFSQLLR